MCCLQYAYVHQPGCAQHITWCAPQPHLPEPGVDLPAGNFSMLGGMAATQQLCTFLTSQAVP